MKRLLVANRGEIARRIFRTARAMGIDTVAVYSDADAQALHVTEAGCAFALGGNTSAESYLRIDKMMAAALATGADAVHPGYGFLSENADFAQAVVNAGLTWVGPPAAAMRAVGSKSAAKRLADELGVPRLPGWHGDDQGIEHFKTQAQRIGYPLIVKAVAGGGGRGMRWVETSDALAAALHSARSEAQASFGNGELLIERGLRQPRHVEVQVFADAHGHCIHLGERDCSVQRRHQKLIEESPSPAVDAALRARLTDCAVRIAQAAGYVGAGTVEFLLDGSAFFLMEINTRLQVEHPVTEAVTGLDLVEWQLRVARGEPLPLQQHELRFSGHAIEVRLCAEDEMFTPHGGRVQGFVEPRGVRIDHALSCGTDVPPHYDSMLAKLIAHAPTRDQAIEQMHRGLSETTLLGLPTNRALLMECLRHSAFRGGEVRIGFLAEQADTLRARIAAREAECLPLAAAAVMRATANRHHGAARPLSLPCPFERPLRLRHRAAMHELRVLEQAPDGLHITLQQQTTRVRFATTQGSLRLTESGVTHAAQCVPLDAHAWHVQVGGVDLFITDASFEPAAASSRGVLGLDLKAPFSGKVVAVHAVAGQTVKAGDTLVVVESMKLEHSIAAPRDARIGVVAVELGQQVSPQQLLLSFEAA